MYLLIIFIMYAFNILGMELSKLNLQECDQLLQISKLLHEWKNSAYQDQYVLNKIRLLDRSVVEHLASNGSRTAQQALKNIPKEKEIVNIRKKEAFNKYISIVRKICLYPEGALPFFDQFTLNQHIAINYPGAQDQCNARQVKNYRQPYLLRAIDQAEQDIVDQNYQSALIALHGALSDANKLGSNDILPQTVAYLNYLTGYSYYQQGKSERAQKYFDRVIEFYHDKNSDHDYSYVPCVYAQMCYYGMGIEQNKKEAWALFAKQLNHNTFDITRNKTLEIVRDIAGENEDVNIYCLLACYGNDALNYFEEMLNLLQNNSVPVDELLSERHKARLEIEPLANQGNQRAQVLLATYFIWQAEATDYKKDYNHAWEWLRKLFHHDILQSASDKQYIYDATCLVSFCTCRNIAIIPNDIINSAITMLKMEADAGNIDASAYLIPLYARQENFMLMNYYFEHLINNMSVSTCKSYVWEQAAHVVSSCLEKKQQYKGETAALMSRFLHEQALYTDDAQDRAKLYERAFNYSAYDDNPQCICQRMFMYAFGHGVDRSYEHAYKLLLVLEETDEGKQVFYEAVQRLPMHYYTMLVQNLNYQDMQVNRFLMYILGRLVYMQDNQVSQEAKDTVSFVLDTFARKNDLSALCLTVALQIADSSDVYMNLCRIEEELKQKRTEYQDMPPEWYYVLNALETRDDDTSRMCLGYWYYMQGLYSNDQTVFKKALTYINQSESQTAMLYQSLMALFGHGVNQSGSQAYKWLQRIEDTAQNGVSLDMLVAGIMNDRVRSCIEEAIIHGDNITAGCALYLSGYCALYYSNFDQSHDYFIQAASKNSIFMRDVYLHVLSLHAKLSGQIASSCKENPSFIVPYIQCIFENNEPDGIRTQRAYNFMVESICAYFNRCADKLIEEEAQIRTWHNIIKVLLEDGNNKTQSCAIRILHILKKYTNEDYSVLTASGLLKSLQDVASQQNHVPSVCCELARIYKYHANIAKDITSHVNKKNLHLAEQYIVCARENHGNMDNELDDSLKKMHISTLRFLASAYRESYSEDPEKYATSVQQVEQFLQKAYQIDPHVIAEDLGFFFLDIEHIIKPHMSEQEINALKNRIKKGVRLLREYIENCDGNINANALMTLGVVCANGVYIEDIGKTIQLYGPNMHEGIKYLEEAFNEGKQEAAIKIGNVYCAQFDVSKSKKKKEEYMQKAIEWYSKAIPDNVVAFYGRGYMYYVAGNYAEAYQDFMQMVTIASNEFPEKCMASHWLLGLMYLQGIGTEKNYDVALQQLKLACQPTQTDLYNINYSTIRRLYLLTSSDAQKSLQEYTTQILEQSKLSDANKDWCYIVGMVCSYGAEKRGPEQDYWLSCLKRAAQEGHIPSQLLLGYSYSFSQEQLSIYEKINFLGQVVQQQSTPDCQAFHIKKAINGLEQYSACGFSNAQVYALNYLFKGIKSCRDANELTGYQNLFEQFIKTMYRDAENISYHQDENSSLPSLMRAGTYGHLKLYTESETIDQIRRNVHIFLGGMHSVYAAYKIKDKKDRNVEEHFKKAINYLESAYQLTPENHNKYTFVKMLLASAYNLLAEYYAKMPNQYENAVCYWCKAADLHHIEAICQFVRSYLDKRMEIIEGSQINIVQWLQYVIQNANDKENTAYATYLLGWYYATKGRAFKKRAIQYLNAAVKHEHTTSTIAQNAQMIRDTITQGKLLSWDSHKSTIERGQVDVLNSVISDAIRSGMEDGLQDVFDNLVSSGQTISSQLVLHKTQSESSDVIRQAEKDGNLKMLESLVCQKNAEASAALGSLYLQGRNDVKTDLTKAKFYIKKCLSEYGGITQDGLFFSQAIFDSAVSWITALQRLDIMRHEDEAIKTLGKYILNYINNKLDKRIITAFFNKLLEVIPDQIREIAI